MDDLSHKVTPIAHFQGSHPYSHNIRICITAPPRSHRQSMPHRMEPLLACSANKTVREYAYSASLPSPSATCKFSLLSNIPTGHAKTVRMVAWAPSGQTLAVASFDSNIGIWERDTGEKPRVRISMGRVVDIHMGSSTLMIAVMRKTRVVVRILAPRGSRNLSVRWRDTRRSVIVWRIWGLGRCWRAVVRITRYGYGKVFFSGVKSVCMLAVKLVL